METIFDIATKQELETILGAIKCPGDKELHDRERTLIKTHPDYGLALLVNLFALRGDIERADAIVEKIEDVQMRHDAMLSLHELQDA